MNQHALEVLELEQIRQIVSGLAATSLGKEAALRMAPIADLAKIRSSLAQTMELSGLMHRDFRLPLAGVHDIKIPIRQVVELHRPFEPKELLELESTLNASKEFYKVLSNVPENCPALKALSRHFVSFDKITSQTEKMIDRRGRIADDATPRLAELRKKKNDLAFKMRGLIEGLIASKNIRKHLQSPDIMLRNGRFVLPVKILSKSNLEGIIQGKSASGETVFIEPGVIVESGNEYQDLLIEESREETTILWRLTRAVLGRKDDILRVRDVLAWMDFTSAKARFAIEFRCAAPEIATNAVLELRDIRHPILLANARKLNPDFPDKWFAQIVPASVRIGDSFTTLIITGPNTGGKTVLLKTVGLSVAMSLSGCPIPAATGCRVPLYSDVLADIGDEQSIEQNLSTFSAHMTNVVDVLKNAGENSLVLLDELGAGTDPKEGAALSQAILNELLRRKARTIVTTHLGELKSYAYTTSGVENASLEFDPATLKPTFRLFMGQAGSSNAVSIAQSLGLPAPLIEDATKMLSGADRSSDELMLKMQELRAAAERNRIETEELLNAAKLRERELAEKIALVEKKAVVVSAEADIELDEKIRAARSKISEALKTLQNAPQPHAEKAAELEKIVDEILVHTPIEQKRREFASNLKKDMDVFVISLNKAGRIRKINKQKEQLTVQVGPMTVETGFSNVSWLNAPAGENR
jgi:DNA mismatch repair protein MutS2